jgi:hypothetical protein
VDRKLGAIPFTVATIVCPLLKIVVLRDISKHASQLNPILNQIEGPTVTLGRHCLVWATVLLMGPTSTRSHATYH